MKYDGWIVVSPHWKRGFLLYTLRNLRRETIEVFLQDQGICHCDATGGVWEQYYAQGYRAVKVRLEDK